MADVLCLQAYRSVLCSMLISVLSTVLEVFKRTGNHAHKFIYDKVCHSTKV